MKINGKPLRKGVFKIGRQSRKILLEEKRLGKKFIFNFSDLTELNLFISDLQKLEKDYQKEINKNEI